jgi:hypothetical protein
MRSFKVLASVRLFVHPECLGPHELFEQLALLFLRVIGNNSSSQSLLHCSLTTRVISDNAQEQQRKLLEQLMGPEALGIVQHNMSHARENLERPHAAPGCSPCW